MADEAEAPSLRQVDARLNEVAVRLSVIENTIGHLAATLATKADVHQLAFDLTWRFIGLMILVLGAHLAGVWYVVSQTLKAHGA